MAAGTRHVMPISRLVAERRMASPSVATRMCERIGSVGRVETAWLTVESPLARSCCLHVNFTGVASSAGGRGVRWARAWRGGAIGREWGPYLLVYRADGLDLSEGGNGGGRENSAPAPPPRARGSPHPKAAVASLAGPSP